MRLSAVFVAAFVSVVASQTAHAQFPCGTTGTCTTFPFSESYSSTGFMAVDFDSGWVPGGSPLQIRATLHIGGSSAVHLQANEGVTYPPSLRAAFDGQPGGYLSIDYGIEVHLYFRFDVLGIGWEGEIPIPFIPSDLRLASIVSFDDLVLLGAAHKPVVAADSSARIRVLSYDLGSFIGGLVSGGIALDIQGMLTASYETQRIRVDHGLVPVTSETGSTTIFPVSGSDYGAGMDVVAHAEGRITHVGAIHLYPSVFIGALGQNFNLDLADLPFNLIQNSNDIRFPDVRRNIPLPDLRVDDVRIDFGNVAMGRTSTKPLIVYNDGNAPMDVEVIIASTVYSVAQYGAFTIPAHSSIDLTPTFRPAGLGNSSTSVVIRANDPDTLMRTVTLAGTSVGPNALLDGGVPDGGPPIDAGPVSYAPSSVGSCGCSIEGSRRDDTRGLLLVAALGTLLLVRRRRRG